MDLTCDHCDESANFACASCLDMVYCSKECQAADWEFHKEEDCIHPNDMTLNAVVVDLHDHYNEHLEFEDPRQELIGLRESVLIGGKGKSKAQYRLKSKKRKRKNRELKKKVAAQKEGKEKKKGKIPGKAKAAAAGLAGGALLL